MQHKFIHLVCHTNYSILESSCTIAKLCELCKQDNMPALALTDTNNMFASMEYCQKLVRSGIKPILGIQINVRYSNITGFVNLLAINQNGYKNLLKLHEVLYKQRSSNSIKSSSIDIQDLLNHSEDIILLTGGTLGLLAKVLNEKKEASEFIEKLKGSFNDNLYIELNRFLIEGEPELEVKKLGLALNYNIPICATNNVYFAEANTYEATDVLWCISQGVVRNISDREYPIKSSYFKTSEQMQALFKDLPEAIENTVKIAIKCNFILQKQELSLPRFSDDEETQIIKEAQQGLLLRLEKEVYPFLSDDLKNSVKEQYFSRLSYELDVINKMGFAGYFLIVSDFIRWAKNNYIPVGPGRGSGAGSLVAWALYIVDINPIRFNLLFERFLNPERVSMPDFDIDFDQDRRDEVIGYVQQKYGKERVAHIITFGTLQAKAAIKDVGRALGIPYSVVDAVVKKIPYSPPSNPINLNKIIAEPVIADEIASNIEIKQVFDIAVILEGLYRNLSTHAAGVVISKEDLINTVPLYYDYQSDFLSVGFSMKYVEDAGLIKFDFLALKTLTIIDKAIKLINSINNINLDIIGISYQDDKISKLFSSGDTLGVFQLESKGMIDVIKQLQPDRIEDIIAIISLYRPGPMENIPAYINIKHGREKIVYQHPLMKDILEETFGIMIYQEQVMQVAQVIAGYTLGGADILRRAMGKKDPKEMEQQRESFVKGALEKNQIDAVLANSIFNQMEKFAGYGFNKSHATAYALISWQTAYLKAYYTAEFICTTMSFEIGNNNKDSYKILELLENAKQYDIEILPPSINYPNPQFAIEQLQGKKNIRYSLLAIKGIGESLVSCLQKEIEKGGKFISIEDFLSRQDSKVINKKQLETLIKSGALDELDNNRNRLFNNIENMMSYINSTSNKKDSNQISLFGDSPLTSYHSLELSDHEDWSYKEKLAYELETIGCFLSNHPLNRYKDTIKEYQISSYLDVIENKQHKSRLMGYLIKSKGSKSKSGVYFSTLTFYDVSSVFSITLFGESYKKYANTLENGEIYVIQTKNKYDDNDEIKLFVDSIYEADIFKNEASKDFKTKKLSKSKQQPNVLKENTNKEVINTTPFQDSPQIDEECFSLNIYSEDDIDILKIWYAKLDTGNTKMFIILNNTKYILDDKKISTEDFLKLKNLIG